MPMYVCICNALKESQVRATAKEAGGRIPSSELFRRLGARPKCGKCVSHATDVMRDEWMHNGQMRTGTAVA